MSELPQSIFDSAPPAIHWAAQDIDGTICWYTERPKPSSDKGRWTGPGRTHAPEQLAGDAHINEWRYTRTERLGVIEGSVNPMAALVDELISRPAPTGYGTIDAVDAKPPISQDFSFSIVDRPIDPNCRVADDMDAHSAADVTIAEHAALLAEDGDTLGYYEAVQLFVDRERHAFKMAKARRNAARLVESEQITMATFMEIFG